MLAHRVAVAAVCVALAACAAPYHVVAPEDEAHDVEILLNGDGERHMTHPTAYLMISQYEPKTGTLIGVQARPFLTLPDCEAHRVSFTPESNELIAYRAQCVDPSALPL